MRTPISSLLLTLLPALSSSGCFTTELQEINDQYRDVIDQRLRQYRLKPGDVIRVALQDLDPEKFSQDRIVILPDGRTDLFFLDDYVARGKTVPEFERDLREKVEEIVTTGEIRVQVEPAGESIYVVGQFERAPRGAIALTNHMTLQQAIAEAGGLRVTGDTDWALLRRPYDDPLRPAIYRIDLNESGGEDLYLLPGDQIVLSRTALAGLINYLREYVFGIFPVPSQFLSAAVLAGI